MIPITIDKFAKEYANLNKVNNFSSFKISLINALNLKEEGETCFLCGQSIWAIGTAITGSNMCFTCITGEADDSEDYEIIR